MKKHLRHRKLFQNFSRKREKVSECCSLNHMSFFLVESVAKNEVDSIELSKLNAMFSFSLLVKVNNSLLNYKTKSRVFPQMRTASLNIKWKSRPNFKSYENWVR